MKFKNALRGLALILTLTLALAPLASAMTVEEARTLLREQYIDPIPEEVLNLPTIEAITGALGDPYTYYMSAEEYRQFQSELNDSVVVGIGVMVEKLSTGLQIISVAPDSPAEGAGLQVGDLLTAADGVTIQQAGSPDALALLIPGQEGTSVNVTYERSGQSHTAAIKRAQVVFPVVTAEVVDDHIGWITSSSFGETTGEEIESYVNEFNAKADRWVVDLRGNPGGYANAVIHAVSLSVGNNVVAYLADRDLNVSFWRANIMPVEIAPILTEPVIVLTDGNSASASELYAAAMRDYGTALLIGERTYGKGIGQEVFEQEDGSAMKVTTFRYYSPRYVTPDRSGVLPNLVVEAGAAGGVARLLSGKAVKNPGADVLVVNLVGKDWYVHKTDALGKDKDAFSALLAALPADAPLTLNGKTVAAAQVAKAWGVSYEDRAFSDVAASPYAEAIHHLAVLGLINGTGEGSFEPKAELTRAQLCALLTDAMGYWVWESDRVLPFTDVAEDDWYYSAVRIMYELGLVSGVSADIFAPDAPVTNEQFLTILSRMGRMADLTVREHLEKVDEAELQKSQAAKFAAWAQPAAAVADQLDYLCMPLEDMDPSAHTTREEAAATVYNLMRYMDVITVTDDYESADSAA